MWGGVSHDILLPQRNRLALVNFGTANLEVAQVIIRAHLTYSTPLWSTRRCQPTGTCIAGRPPSLFPPSHSLPPFIFCVCLELSKDISNKMISVYYRAWWPSKMANAAQWFPDCTKRIGKLQLSLKPSPWNLPLWKKSVSHYNLH